MLKYALASNLTIKKIRDELFIFDRSNGVIHTFNTTGSAFWEKLADNSSFDKVTDELAEEYQVHRETVASDLFDFIQTLAEKKLLSIGV